MAKHSKGKHSAPNTEQKKRDEDRTSLESAESEEKGDPKLSEEPSDGVRTAEAVANADEASDSVEGAALTDAPSESIKGGHVRVASSEEISEATVTSEKAADPSESDRHIGKHAAVDIADTTDMEAYLGQHNNAVSTKEERRKLREERKRQKRELKEQRKAERKRTPKQKAKIFAIAFGSVFGTAALVYLAGVALFSFRFMPNTTASDLDLSWKSPAEVQSEFQEAVGTYSFKVKGEGLNFVVTAKEAGMSLDGAALTDAVMDSQNPWQWPLEVFQPHEAGEALTDALSATYLADVVQKAVDEVNVSAVDPVDAYIAFNEPTSNFGIIAEVPGTKLDGNAVLEEIVLGAMTLEEDILIDESALVPPAVLKDDERLLTALDQANELIKADLSVCLDGNPATEVNALTISPWVSVTPEFEVVLDAEAMSDYVGEIAQQCNTVGSTRTYTRPDGKVITVSGGSYGWKIDSDELATQLSEAILAGTVGQLDIPVLQSGTGFSEIGGQDWGSRYVDVDISEQHARFYDGGEIIWESDFVSGARGRHDSPRGVYYLNGKASPTTLVGRKPDGEIDYETKVQFWMPFKGNSVGFHDATWQAAFGGSRYASGFGSHGCINLPYSKAQELYGIIGKGDVVVVHD